jgi:hypothetical protein
MSEQDTTSMRHILGHNVMGLKPEVPITEKRYNAIKDALPKLDAAFQIEEAYDAIIRNYRALELAQAEISISHVIDRALESADFDEHRRALATHVNNLLSAARFFLDVTPQRIQVLGGKPMCEDFKKLTNEVWDNNQGYRFMEALRNYSQHHGASVTGLMMKVGRRENDVKTNADDWQLVHTMEARVQKADVLPAFKEKVRPDVEALADKKGNISLTKPVREYMVGLNAVMLKTRELMARAETDASDINQQAIEDLKSAGGPGVGLSFMIVDSRGVASEMEPLAVMSADRLYTLRKRNGSIQHLTKSIRHS